jgi:hypothetical protein
LNQRLSIDNQSIPLALSQPVVLAIERTRGSVSRIFIETSGCHRFGILHDPPMSKLHSLVTDFHPDLGFRSCDDVCVDAAAVLVSYWKSLNPVTFC